MAKKATKKKERDNSGLISVRVDPELRREFNALVRAKVAKAAAKKNSDAPLPTFVSLMEAAMRRELQAGRRAGLID